jgi:hypothetical protein
MRVEMKRVLLVLATTTFVQGAVAQETPSTIGIIDGGSKYTGSSDTAADLSSGRYKVKPRNPKKEKPLTEEYKES